VLPLLIAMAAVATALVACLAVVVIAISR